MSSISSPRPVGLGVRLPRPAGVLRRMPGVALAVAVAGGATALSGIVGLGSGPVLGIVLGLVLGTALDLLGAGHLNDTGRRFDAQRVLRPGVSWSASVPLRAAVVVLGAELPLGAVAGEGVRSLPGIVVTLTGCLLVARVLGRRLGIPRRLRTLVGVGTAICGASAIAAVTPVIDAEETEVGYGVATIFLFNVLAVLLFPLLGHALGLGPHGFGVFAGTAVNDLSSVVAAATLYGPGALHTAVIVKLTRTLMIVPICVVLGRRFRAAGAGAGAGAAEGAGAGAVSSAPAPAPAVAPARDRIRSAAALVPGFLVLFACMAGLRGAGVIPGAWAGTVSETATLLITVALSAVGLSVDLAGLRRAGLRPLALGAVLWVTVSLLSLGCQAAGLL
ncbi:MAG TPA: putative sulfate exporter family transporter [Solirubrobacteraceae bacterium]|nr:putative sulfate exporter family transporter [Solirubrobacteraceae bacterium]